jgi:cobyrinic acid a,c-diamide synthase
VVLVVDARGMAASAAALVAGFARHRPGVALAGVILNRVGAPAHLAVLREAILRATPEVAVLGALPRAAALELPSRHLGLVQAQELARLEETIAAAGALAARHLDLAALAALARPAPVAAGAASPPLPPPGQRVAVARDAAFAFAYEATLAGWRAAGAEILPFSPLAAESPPAAADTVFLPGGYPELHAGQLAAATAFRDGLAAAAARGAWVYGECGGYMALGAGLIDARGLRHRMAGLLPVETSFAAPRLHLGYRDATLLADAAPGRAGESFRGHEFHYASVVGEGDLPALFAVADARGQSLGSAGRRAGRVAGSFLHLVDQRIANPVA